jgi:hypothetical protein
VKVRSDHDLKSDLDAVGAAVRAWLATIASSQRGIRELR